MEKEPVKIKGTIFLSSLSNLISEELTSRYSIIEGIHLDFDRHADEEMNIGIGGERMDSIYLMEIIEEIIFDNQEIYMEKKK